MRLVSITIALPSYVMPYRRRLAGHGLPDSATAGLADSLTGQVLRTRVIRTSSNDRAQEVGWARSERKR